MEVPTGVTGVSMGEKNSEMKLAHLVIRGISATARLAGSKRAEGDPSTIGTLIP